MKNLLLPLLFAACLSIRADEAETSWEHAPTDYKVPPGMVFGGAFIDRILPMPVRDGLESDVWGGDNVKHGDLSSALYNPTPEVDVHMSPDGANFTCATCHVSDKHAIAGSRYAVLAKDTGGTGKPG